MTLEAPDQESSIERAFIESLLEERFGRGDAASHLEPEVRRSPGGRWRILAAAVLVLGAGAVATAWWLNEAGSATDGDDQRSARPIPDQQGPDKPDPEGQDKTVRPEISTNRWEPPNAAALREALPDIHRVRVRLRVLGNATVKVADFPHGPLAAILSTPSDLVFLRRELAKALEQTPVEKSGPSVAEIRLELPKHKHVEIDMQARRGGLNLAITGLGTYSIGSELAKRIVEQISDKKIARQTIAQLGLAIPNRLTDLPSDAPHLRLHDFDVASITKLDRFAEATSIDLRFAPKVNGADGLRALHQLLPDLLRLRIRGDRLDREAWREIARFRGLTDLQVLSPNGSYWGIPAQRDARNVDDSALVFLSKLKKLRSLVLPGSELTDAGLALLAELPELHRLHLSGSPRIRGTGFSAFGSRSKLDEVHLNACTGLDDDGLRAVAKLPNLRQVFLRNARFLRDGFAGLEGSIGADALATFGDCAELRRLELGGWFAMSSTHGPAFAEAAKDKDGSILSAPWRTALARMCKAPKLEWLAIDGCPDLVLADFAFLKDSSIRTLNVAGTVGASPARVPEADMDKIFDLPRDLQTMISEH